ncbi:DUF445 family protein [bacterium]|nr:DUF445 family protein [bacterium]
MSYDVLFAIAKGAILGGAIGWATNKLAVWMLFNPKRAWHIAGVRVPLTPGLVVKNQHRLAEAVGRSIGRDLLDPESVAAELKDVQLARRIASELSAQRTRFAARDLPLSAVIGADALPGVSRAVAGLVSAKADGLLTEMLAPQGMLRRELGDLLADLGGKSLGELLGEDGIVRIRASFLAQATRFAAGDALRGPISQTVEKALAALPDSEAFAALEATARSFVEGRSPAIAAGFQESLAEYLEGEEFGDAVRPRLANRLHAAIVERFPMARMLVSEAILSDLLTQRWPDLAGELSTIARDEGVNRFLSAQLDRGADNLIESLRETLADEEQRARFSDWLTGKAVDGVREFIEGDTLATRIDALIAEWSTKPLRELLPGDGAWLGEQADNILARIGNRLTRPESRAWLESQIASQVERTLVELPIRQVMELVPAEQWQRVEERIALHVEERAVALAPTILRDELRLDELVTRKIEDFEARKLEDTINKVSGRELTGIIRLGGLIGVVVGVLSELLLLVLR